MLNILVDEAYAFDYLAILEIKKDLSQSAYKSWIMCKEHISKQLDITTWESIILSKEYRNLIDINKEVFVAVDAARYGNISAKEVDTKNMQRYYAKKALQEKFFPSGPLTEHKT